MFLSTDQKEILNEEEELLVEVMEALGIDPRDESYYNISQDEILNEASAYKRSKIYRGKKEKLSALTGAQAVLIAKKRKDPLYAKLKKAAALRRNWKAAIQKKYGNSALAQAKKVMRKSLAAPAVEMPKDKTIDES